MNGGMAGLCGIRIARSLSLLRLGFTNIRISLFFSTSVAKIVHFRELVSPNSLKNSNLLLLITYNVILFVTNLLIIAYFYAIHRVIKPAGG